MRRRSSIRITLVMVGVVALSACSDQKRSIYRSRQDCVEDWGDDKKCEEAPSGSTHHHMGYWYGPRWSGSASRGTRSVGSVTVSRGGFGRFGSFHSSFGG
jgi:uncharacterized protein YgiB involved in biofilm formation